MATNATSCTHLAMIREVEPSANGCEECIKLGDSWQLLRMCLVCGHVGCCDTSKGKHATQHFHDSGHPIAKMLERPEESDWCYIDEVYIR